MTTKEFFENINTLTEEAVIEFVAKGLRKTLGESVDYGYDAKEREFFFSVPEYSKCVYIKQKSIRERRWDILMRAVQLLEAEVNKVKFANKEYPV